MGFKGGDLEGKWGRFNEVGERDDVHVWQGTNWITIPVRFVKPVHPVCPGQTVVAIRGENLGREFLVVKVDGSDCDLASLPTGTKGGRVASRTGVSRRRVDVTLPDNFLAVL
jgi:hypothetical protein